MRPQCIQKLLFDVFVAVAYTQKSVDEPPYSSTAFTGNSSVTMTEIIDNLSKWKVEMFEVNAAAGDAGSTILPRNLYHHYRSQMGISGFDKGEKGTAYFSSYCLIDLNQILI